MAEWIVTGTSPAVEADSAEEAVFRAEQSGGWHWEAKEVATADSELHPNHALVLQRLKADPEKALGWLAEMLIRGGSASDWGADELGDFLALMNRVTEDYNLPEIDRDSQESWNFWGPIGESLGIIDYEPWD